VRRTADLHDAVGHPPAAPGLEWVEHQRRHALELMAALVRHRQRGADLVYEAYSVDIGGED
jgi:hypothetical protein